MIPGFIPTSRDTGLALHARYHPEQELRQHAALASQPSSVVYNASFRLAAPNSQEIREIGAGKEYSDGNMKVMGQRDKIQGRSVFGGRESVPGRAV
jgi:hypothetical protein